MVAAELDVPIRTERLTRYPMIKCNVNSGTQERIFHLPFDQQYDKVIIGNQPGEFYAETVEEAEREGFRRAFPRRCGVSKALDSSGLTASGSGWKTRWGHRVYVQEVERALRAR